MTIRDLSSIECEPGIAVTPEWLNNPTGFSYEFQNDFTRYHRVEDGEHMHPIPDAAGTIRWDGSKYVVIGDARNIESVSRNAPGDVTVTLKCNSQRIAGWFPRVVPLDFHGFGWEYDDSLDMPSPTRTTNRCRVRIAAWKRDFIAEGEPVPEPVPQDGSFRFEAYMVNRAIGAGGIGDATAGEPTHAVRHRICVDGVESAQHTNAVYQFCNWLRDTFGVGHNANNGDHDRPWAPGVMPLGCAYFKASALKAEPAEVEWATEGAFESLSWYPGSPVVFRATQGTARWAHTTLRYRGPGIPPTLYPWFERDGDGRGGKAHVTEPFYNPAEVGVGLVVFGR